MLSPFTPDDLWAIKFKDADSTLEIIAKSLSDAAKEKARAVAKSEHRDPTKMDPERYKRIVAWEERTMQEVLFLDNISTVLFHLMVEVGEGRNRLEELTEYTKELYPAYCRERFLRETTESNLKYATDAIGIATVVIYKRSLSCQ